MEEELKLISMARNTKESMNMAKSMDKGLFGIPIKKNIKDFGKKI